MTNTELLRSKIEANGYKLHFVAQKCGLTYQAFLNKVNNKTEFKVSEVHELQILLKLSDAEVKKIFFSP